VINQIDGSIITFRDGRCSSAISSDCGVGKVATFASETYARLGANSAPAVGRKPALVNGSLLEAKRNASHPLFVNFGSDAKSAFRLHLSVQVMLVIVVLSISRLFLFNLTLHPFSHSD
jgi:hypothetical protein